MYTDHSPIDEMKKCLNLSKYNPEGINQYSGAAAEHATKVNYHRVAEAEAAKTPHTDSHREFLHGVAAAAHFQAGKLAAANSADYPKAMAMAMEASHKANTAVKIDRNAPLQKGAPFGNRNAAKDGSTTSNEEDHHTTALSTRFNISPIDAKGMYHQGYRIHPITGDIHRIPTSGSNADYL